MLWGAKKIRILLFKQYPEDLIPSVVTVHNILSRNGLVKPQKRSRRVKPVFPIFDPKKCNEVWSADYKGKFLMGKKYTVIRLKLLIPRAGFCLRQKDITKRTFSLSSKSLQRFSESMVSQNKYIPTTELPLDLYLQFKDIPGYLTGLLSWELIRFIPTPLDQIKMVVTSECTVI